MRSTLSTRNGFIKYPRTLHLPWSRGESRDDLVMDDTHVFDKREIVVTEKMDGENISLYGDGLGLHARSLDGRSHPSRDWLKNLYGQMGHEIPVGYRICGEYLYAQHSIAYRNLPGYFLVFGVYDNHNTCLGWEDTMDWAGLLGLPLVPWMYQGIWNRDLVEQGFGPQSFYGDETEGFVVRVVTPFHYDYHYYSVAKYVRQSHVRTNQHWMHSEIVPNGLKEGRNAATAE